ncbi:MAG: transglycosylase SLT domain-containing protein [Saprospiraceae bacterium]|nr:transglycosylase SLT domain-containing protein [Saprospiraceae bacterium]
MTFFRQVGLVLLFANMCSFLAISQVDPPVSGDLEDPADTSEVLTAKGGAANAITDKELKERLASISSCVDMRINGVVKGYIRTYVEHKTEKAKIMLGKRLTYFPLYEAKFKEYGLPDDLKYLSVVESALNAKAVSRVGATGLWQFMPSTGGEYGLHTNNAVEDRSNPVKSTDAAARHLRDLYKKFDDWALALAAYNSGAGRVSSAIKRAGSRDFWQIQRFLPLETRNYVPAFIAATYICNYFYAHDITPYDPDMDQQLTDYINVYEGVSFQDIADATGISVEVIKELNPGFKRDYVPPTTDGNFVVAPKRVMPALIRYLNSISNARSYKLEKPEEYTSPELGDGRYWQSTATLREAMTVQEYAKRVGMCAEHIKAWNDLTHNYLSAGQKLKLFRPVFVQKHAAIKIDAPDAVKNKPSAPSVKKQEPTPTGAKPSGKQTAGISPTPPEPVRVKQWQYHTVKRNESLEDIARLYSTSVESIKKNNNCQNIKFGNRLKIREL